MHKGFEKENTDLDYIIVVQLLNPMKPSGSMRTFQNSMNLAATVWFTSSHLLPPSKIPQTPELGDFRKLRTDTHSYNNIKKHR